MRGCSCCSPRTCHALNGGQFLEAFRRFVARRGFPSVIYSDNAKCFKRASRELRAVYDIVRRSEVGDYLSAHNIKWKFSADRAPWWGGFWERMVRSVKDSLRKALGKSLLDHNQMSTVLTEIEAIINSRPLTYSYPTPQEPEVLTPAHFLHGKRLTALPDLQYLAVESSSHTELLKNWVQRQNMQKDFWNRWYKEYLILLRSAHNRPVADITNVVEGSIVIVRENSAPKLCWKLARVLENITGNDGVVRACRLRLGNGKIITRPVQHLSFLEIRP